MAYYHVFLLFTAALAAPAMNSTSYHTTPYPASTLVVGGEGILPTSTHGGALGGALYQTDIPRGLKFPPPPSLLTMTFTNLHTNPASTSHAVAASSPTVVSGDVGPGTMAVSETAEFVVPTNWAGMVAVGDAKWPITGEMSRVEANFVYRPEPEYLMAVADIDVSYVDGFTLPITCSCEDRVLTGCNKDLYALSACPEDNGQGSCLNPLRGDDSAGGAVPFFAPCQGAAYTFPQDHDANAFGKCQSSRISCCIGASCPPNLKPLT